MRLAIDIALLHFAAAADFEYQDIAAEDGINHPTVTDKILAQANSMDFEFLVRGSKMGTSPSST